eukprot:12381133-Ditylum_brightwellii.AAC.1
MKHSRQHDVLMEEKAHRTKLACATKVQKGATNAHKYIPISQSKEERVSSSYPTAQVSMHLHLSM